MTVAFAPTLCALRSEIVTGSVTGSGYREMPTFGKLASLHGSGFFDTFLTPRRDSGWQERYSDAKANDKRLARVYPFRHKKGGTS